MATFMEKDVLIECISTALGLTAYNNNLDHPARIELLELRNKLYGMEPEEINYKEELSFIKDKKAILNCNMKLNSIQIYNFINFFKKNIQRGSII